MATRAPTPCAGSLIRPDGHVAWVGEGSDEGLRAALATWFGPPAGAALAPAPARGIVSCVGIRDSYAPGTFSWADLGTTDPGGATEFYGALLGWTCEELPAGPAGAYRRMRVDGHDVAGVYAQPPERRRAGAPPTWTSYVTVADADAAASRAAELGGAVLAEPFEVMDAGRVAVIADPQGAVLALWQARSHPGARLVNDPGAMVLNQLNTTDPEAAAAFYRGLFGWSVERVADDPVPYWGIRNRGALNGGMMALDPAAQAPPHWLVYFTTADLDGAAEIVPAGGGAVLVPPTTVPGGRILVARDPQGAHFALFEGAVDP